MTKFLSRFTAMLVLLLVFFDDARSDVPTTSATPSSCSAVPRFARERGVSAPVFSTVDRFKSGMLMHQQLPGGQLGPAMQLPSWSRAGSLGAFVVTETGDIFVIPVPSVNTLQNSFEKQNTIYRITNDEGLLEEFLSLPVDSHPSQANPFGLVGLTYDCSTKLLYASSVSGSRFDQERGAVFAISVRSAAVIARFDNFDVLGLAVGTTKRGRELFLGRAREGIVYRLTLGTDGSFKGKAEQAIRFDESDELRARKIKFLGDEIHLFTTEFYFNLVALSEFKQPTMVYRYDGGRDTWNFRNILSRDIIEYPVGVP